MQTKSVEEPSRNGGKLEQVSLTLSVSVEMKFPGNVLAEGMRRSCARPWDQRGEGVYAVRRKEKLNGATSTDES